MTRIEFKLEGLANAVAALRAPTRGKVDAWAQQSLNRAGASVKSEMDREFRATILPVKASATKRRIRWANADKNGKPGVLRFLGFGKYGGSGAIRPRAMNLRYPKHVAARGALGRFSGSQLGAKANRVSYGVGGAVPQRTVLGGFVVSRKGLDWRQTSSLLFDPTKALVFRRKGKKRLPIELASPAMGSKGPTDVTVGGLAKAAGLPQRAADRIGVRAAEELTKRIEREIKAAASAGTGGVSK